MYIKGLFPTDHRLSVLETDILYIYLTFPCFQMEISLLLSFMAATFLLALMPGADNIYVITESVSKGYKTGVTISSGLCSGVLVHTIAAATGLSVFLLQSDFAFTVIKYVGSAYLLYLAYQAYHEPTIEIKYNTIGEESFKFCPLWRKGVLMNVLNPKVSLFFIAFLPQFITEDGLYLPYQMIALGVVFMIESFLVFSLVAFLSGQLSRFLKNPNFQKGTKYVKVAVLVVLAITLALSSK